MSKVKDALVSGTITAAGNSAAVATEGFDTLVWMINLTAITGSPSIVFSLQTTVDPVNGPWITAQTATALTGVSSAFYSTTAFGPYCRIAYGSPGVSASVTGTVDLIAK